jgi:hypothetical protein
MASNGSLEHYAREIECLWSQFLSGPVVLSPGDWRWISAWHRRGIPLALIAECLEEASARRRRARGSTRPRGLSYVAAAVDEAWEVIVDGRTEPAPRSASMPPVDPLSAWRRRMEQEPASSRLRSLLARLIDAMEAGADAAGVDTDLSRGVAGSVAPELREETEREARAALGTYRSRLTAEQFENALRQAVAQRLRRLLRLPRLVPDPVGPLE